MTAPDGSKVFFTRGYEPGSLELTLEKAFLSEDRLRALPNFVPRQGDAPELVPG